jgi:hypothetical protein
MKIVSAISALWREANLKSAIVGAVGVVIATIVVPGLSNADPILNPLNGHYYQAVVFPEERDFVSWATAKSAAESAVFMGERGYLATITSKEENDFLIVNFGPVRSPRGELWVGGSDEAVNGEWRWVVGPEAGTLFWLGGPSGTQIVFADWAPGEPNNSFGDESRLGWSELGWNDLPASGFGSVKPGYIVEFNGVPEPSTFTLLGPALVMFGLIRLKNKSRAHVGVTRLAGSGAAKRGCMGTSASSPQRQKRRRCCGR